ncbi:MAG: DNA gyrase subunit A [Alphaproteobacteria bacterium CG11_big_fil_rev_8_21_14_0_20_44_7]|nr:MAG: DNA gyrase subunit A [Alphaproteobacteria bacterium CG11_big_fil_rev_8_21_14_0_20_44_7]
MNDEIAKYDNTQPISIESEMKSSYLDYAMSVIVSRAIPDVRDGLKPVQRRILYAMHEAGIDYNKPYKKSARIVGDVMGKYHPHGDSAIYDTLVRMAQPFSMRELLIDGQGNFGSMDGDNAAAMRYTESRLKKISHTMLSDLDKETVDFRPNYDGQESEPSVLPAAFPNLLVNGSGGIAVGMATNIPPHNLGEVIDVCCLYIDNPEVTFEEVLEVMPAPDFPTGGTILGRVGSRSALSTGRGSVVMRAKSHFEKMPNGREAVIFTEMPYQTNKVRIQERIGELVREKKIEGIAEMRDESNKDGVRLVIEVKKDVIPEVIQNQLFHLTTLQTSFGVNMLALDGGRPRQLNVLDVIRAFVLFREEVITRRTNFLLGKARDRAHVLIGLAMAVANIDEVIKIIRGAKDPAEAREELMSRSWNAAVVEPLIKLVDEVGNDIVDGKAKFTEVQARAILDMKLARLTGLEQERISGELDELATQIKDYLETLSNRDKLYGILREELVKIKEEFATERRTNIEESEYEQDIEDLIQREEMVVSVTQRGYIKRVPLTTYRAQRRGGKGRAGVAMRDDEDVARKVFVANTHTPVLFFSNIGKVYKTKVYQLPLGSPTSMGKALVNIFPLEAEERITNVMPMPEEEDKWDEMNIVFATTHGNIRRNDLSDFKDVRSNGKIAMKLEGDERLIGVRPCSPSDHIMLSASSGQSIRFPVEAVRVFKSRNSTGVRGMKFKNKGDQLVSISILSGQEFDMEKRAAFLKIPVELRQKIALDAEAAAEVEAEIANILGDELVPMAQNEDFILTLTENGYGKRSSAYEYRVTNRGGSGIVNIVTSDRNGKVVASNPVEENDEIIVVTDKGKLIRTPVNQIRIAGRATQGVTILKVAAEELVISATRIQDVEGEEGDDEELDGEEAGVAEAAEGEAASEGEPNNDSADS